MGGSPKLMMLMLMMMMMMMMMTLSWDQFLTRLLRCRGLDWTRLLLMNFQTALILADLVFW
jgi:hypothetical protein